MTAFLQREILPRTVTHKFGESPTAERRFVVSTDGETAQQDVLAQVGIYHLSPHPEWPFLLMMSVTATETDPYHSEITYSYSMPAQKDLDPNPLARPDVWNFSAGGSSVPAVDYYFGAGNGELKALDNAAQDPFEGVTKTEAELTATISGNRANFDVGLAKVVTNCINDSVYLGGAKYTWLCTGISGVQATEMVNDAELRYWQVGVTLIYRQSTHLLKIADCGFNYLDAGVKKRCFVVDDAGTEVPSANPMPLDAAGAMLPYAQSFTTLERRMHPEINFQTYFGVPPF
jgi:hypothetical protein